MFSGVVAYLAAVLAIVGQMAAATIVRVAAISGAAIVVVNAWDSSRSGAKRQDIR